MTKINIAVVSHKDYRFPEDESYIPYFVGPICKQKAPSEAYRLDIEGENIAEKNPNYCELTAQYNLWKNSDADIKGLVHYRRLFIGNNAYDKRHPQHSVLTTQQIETLLTDYDLIVPNQRHYYIETLWSHYEHSHHIEGLQLTKHIIETEYPNYYEAFEKVMHRRSAHMFNMFIAKASVFDAYSEWLFEVLGKVEAQLDISNYSVYEARVFGYLSELLLDVFLEVHPYRYCEQTVKFIEPQNWVKKGGTFLLRKLKGGIIDGASY